MVIIIWIKYLKSQHKPNLNNNSINRITHKSGNEVKTNQESTQEGKTFRVYLYPNKEIHYMKKLYNPVHTHDLRLYSVYKHTDVP